MKLIRGLINLQQQSLACVATIGNFDGVHLGHQAIVKRVISKAQSLGLPSCVLLFEPHPNEFFMGNDCPARLTCFREKYNHLKALGVDKLVVLQFNKTLSQMNAENFVTDILIEKLAIKHLVIGDDFHFGHKRMGNYQLLEDMGVGQYTLEPTSSVLVDNERVSSTLVREMLALSETGRVYNLLGRRYSVAGKVGYGDQLGREIGFPTANVAIKRKKMPLKGVFLVKANWCVAGKSHQSWGVANSGIRPTVDGNNYRLEVHLLGVSAELYGIELVVDFYAQIRTEKKFSGLDELKQQINLDIQAAEKLIEQSSR